MPRQELPFTPAGEDDVELVLVDLGVARAFWEGVSTGRLLARVRLHRDEHDLVDHDERASGVDFADASWDIAIAHLLASAPAALDRVKHGVARHARAASDEGPLAANDAVLAALVHAYLSSADADASPAEGLAEGMAVDELVRFACARLDERLGRAGPGRTAAAFEACLFLSKRAAATPWPLDAFRAAIGSLTAVMETDVHDSGGYPSVAELPDTVTASSATFYPSPDGAEGIPRSDRRACLLDRPSLERVLLLPERELEALAKRARARYADVLVQGVLDDVAPLVAKHGALVLFATPEPRSQGEAPPLPPASWQPPDVDASESAAVLAAALERGAVTAPRVRSVMSRGGADALDALGKEMLDVAAHPFASAVFAEVLAGFGRERDVVRLVTYFAIAPDPSSAARALSLCGAREEVCKLLKGWLETMLPRGRELAAPGASARIASCVAALRPYPGLYDVVLPLLSRLTNPPPAP